MITVKEEFLGSVKVQQAVELAGWEVVAVWLALKGYADGNLSRGFIPHNVIHRLPGIPPKKLTERALKALLECGKEAEDGTRGAGLIEPHPRGYKLHDYEDHATPVEREEERRRRAREQKRNRRAELARVRGLSADKQADMVTDELSDTGSENSEDGPDNSADESGENPADNPRAGVRAAGRARDPQPSPTQKEDLRTTTNQRPESKKTAAAPVVVGGENSEPEGPIPCPANLRLTEAQVGTLEMSRAVPRYAIDDLTTRFVANHQADPSDKRTLAAWRKCLSQAICSWYGNPKFRPKKPEGELENGGYGAAEEWAT